MNRFGILAAWVLATAVAVGVASQAVGLVADRAVGIPVQVPVAAGDQSSVGPITTVLTDPATPTTVSPAPSTTTPPTTALTTTTAAGGTTATTTATTTTSTTPLTTATTTIPTPLDSRTFFLSGGQVSAACSGPDTITYLSAVPLSGWDLDVESSGPAQVRVDFESGEEESEIKIVCVNGQLEEDISD